MITKLKSTFMIEFYVQKSFSLNIGYLENLQINNKTLQFVNLLSKEVPINISYPIIVNRINGNLDAWLGPSYVRYIFTREK